MSAELFTLPGDPSRYNAATPAEGASDCKAAELARQLRLPFIDLATAAADQDALDVLPEHLAQRFECIPLRREHDASGRGRPILVLAMANPLDLAAIENIEFATGHRIRAVVASNKDVSEAIERLYSPERWLRDFLRNVPDTDDVLLNETTEAADPPKVDEYPAVKLVNLILNRGVRQNASDIHVEPDLHGIQVRFRISGVLREFSTFPKWLQNPLVSRLKVLSNLDIADRRRPQDGRLKLQTATRQVDIRVSTLPTNFGEKVVLRILGAGFTLPDVHALGVDGPDLEILRQASEQPQGMILVTGPTGSGKTTTLYSILRQRKDPSVNIVTVEDPIEYQIPGINQVQVNSKAGMTFATCLRSILRQDPDIILVGEIRDTETQEIAFHAALTGHLVLSTLHTNSTVATITRLADLGVDPYVMSDSLNVVVAQRLLRRTCESCREMYRPSRSDLQRLNMEKAKFPFWRGVGCEKCGHTGYEGRFAIYEVLRMTPRLRELIVAKASEAEIRKAAVASGTRLLVDQAITKIQSGLTTVEEVLRVVQVELDCSRCPGCGCGIEAEFVVCPSCSYELKRTCHSCRQELKLEWKTCPYCNSVTSQTDKTVHAITSVKHPRTSEQEPSVEKRTRILVVDDEPVSRRLAIAAMQTLPGSPEVFSAADGLSCLRMAGELKPDLVLLDLLMPGMDGFEVCAKLRQEVETAFIPILMLTASSSDEHRLKGYLIGTDDYMAKPFSIPELHARVLRLLRRTYGA
ncbi:MAG TPA: ATPase, T2SS/T4P/T4SS family [Terriglobales bacterium]|nr:ATPase, T2SS/T4P/T4SS family [Terriglobales bacterium]